MAKEKTENWIKPRHQVVRVLVDPVLKIMVASKYKTKIEKFDKAGQYLVLYNHQTPYDQFFVALSFKKHLYYLATEDIFSAGFVSSLLRFGIAPIPIKKSTIDVGSLKTCLRVVKEGGSLAIAPEGNRTYSGRTEYINPSIASLAKKIGLPILLYRIEGGYGAEPRWSDDPRRGPNRAYVSKEITKEELDALSKEELYKIICEGLDVREDKPEAYQSDKRAEYIERMLYVCPQCGFASFESSGNEFHCKTCGQSYEYAIDKRIIGKGFNSQFEFAADWYNYQKQFVNKADITKLIDKPIFVDDTDIYKVILNKNKQLLYKNIKSRLYGNRIELAVCEAGDADCGAGSGEKSGAGSGESLDTQVLMFDDISGIAVLGRNKINVYHENTVYQFSGNKRFNGLKYLNIYTRYKNITEGKADDEFLGL